MAEWGTGTVTEQVCRCVLTAVPRARFLAGSHLCYCKNNLHLSHKKPQPINQPTFIVKQIWAVETQLLCPVKLIFSKSQTHKLNFTHHLSLLNLLTPGLGPGMLPHSQPMAQGLSRLCAAPVQHQGSSGPATANRSLRMVFLYRGFNFKQRDFWWCFFPHLLYIESRTHSGCGISGYHTGQEKYSFKLRALQWSHYCAWKLRTFHWRDRSAIFWRKGMTVFFHWQCSTK